MRGEVVGTDNGSAAIIPAGPIVAGTHGFWTITYTVGPEGVGRGGTIRFEIPYGFAAPQLHWRDALGYAYCTGTREDANLHLSLDKPLENDAYVTRWGRHLFVTVAEGSLEAGDQVALHYGRYTAGGRWLDSPVAPFVGTVEFTVATDCHGFHDGPFSGFYLVPGSPTLRLVGGPPTSVCLSGPSLVTPGAVSVACLALDAFRNPADDSDLEIRLTDQHGELLSDWVKLAGPEPATVEVPVPRIGPALVFAQSRGGEKLGCLPLRSSKDSDHNLYWGDLHSHTVLSDGLGTVDDYMRFARDTAGLDFCAIGDHSQYLSDEDWRSIQDATRAYNQPGRFTTFLAHEYSHNSRGLPYYGDKVVVFPDDEAPLYRATTDLTKRVYTDLAEIGPKWRDLGAILTIHCHARGVTSYYDPELVRLLEIYSIWGSAEREGCERQMLPSQERNYAGDFAQDALNAGYRVGFIASGDEHAGLPGLGSWLRVWEAYPAGLTAVLAQENTRESLWEALWSRRCYATSGARVILDFSVNSHPMGSIIGPADGPVRIEATAIGTAPIREITVVRNGEDWHSESGVGHFAHLRLLDTPPSEGAYYYLRVVQVDGEQAWASPIWIDPAS